jgi:hypothetical protein
MPLIFQLLYDGLDFTPLCVLPNCLPLDSAQGEGDLHAGRRRGIKLDTIIRAYFFPIKEKVIFYHIINVNELYC